MGIFNCSSLLLPKVSLASRQSETLRAVSWSQKFAHLKMERFSVAITGALFCATFFVFPAEGQYNFVPPRRHPTAVPPAAVAPPLRVFREDVGCAGRSPGFYSNPNNCYKFYRCVEEGATLKRYDFDCAPGTAYDPTLSVCNFPGQGGTFQECEQRAPPPTTVVVHVEQRLPLPEPTRPRPPQRRPAVEVVVHQSHSQGGYPNESGYPNEDYNASPNPGNYGQREPNYGNRRPSGNRINDRQPNPNRENVRFWSNKNGYADYE